MKSVFAANVRMPRFDRLSEDASADVLVIGGGITGILTAYLLQDAGVDVLLVEAGRLCHGQTANTTAKITVQHGFIYADLLRRFGKEGARQYWDANNAALAGYRRMAREIDCDFRIAPFYAYAMKDRRALGEELAALSAIGANAGFSSASELPFETVGAVVVPDQAAFQPLQLLAALAARLRVAEQTTVVSLHEGGAVTRDGVRITARHTVVATHFPFLRFRAGFPFKMYQSRSYVLGIEGVEPLDGMYADGKGEHLSLRTAGNCLLIGGAGHRTGVQGGGYDELADLASIYYPHGRIKYRFAAQDCITPDHVPYIGRYGKNTDNLWVATGFGKWGMTTAMVAAMLLRDSLLGIDNPYAKLFSPGRSPAVLGIASNMMHTLWHYLRPTVPRCPHLGCALVWNRQEQSWDCPCHGSRFDRSGKWLDNPAIRDLRKKPRS